MRTLNTINGVVTAGEINWICPHEHLFLDMTHEAVLPKTKEERRLFNSDISMDKLGVLRRNPYVVRSNLILDSVDDAVAELESLTKYGCDLLVDVTSVGLGRDVVKLKEVCERTNINIVAGCGLFVHDSLSPDLKARSVSELSRWMIDEIENGIGSTGIRPGVIGEIGTSEIIYEVELKSLLASAEASVKTGLPIYLHTYPWSRAGLEAIKLLRDNGVSAKKICICHLDVTFDYDYLKLALEQGVYVEFDNFGKEFYFESTGGAFSGGPFETDVERVRMLRRLIGEGHASRLMLANDLCLKASMKKYGGWGYDHVLQNICPMMTMEGISEEDVQTMVYSNPKNFLFGEE